MELAIRIQIEQLAEALCLATSDELLGLVAQGRTVAETLEIARDVARKLLEARRDRDGISDLRTILECREFTIVVADGSTCGDSSIVRSHEFGKSLDLHFDRQAAGSHS